MDKAMQNLVKQVFPDFPEDRQVAGTRDVMSWYRIRNADSTLLVPPINVLRGNMREVDRFAEAVRNFATADLTSSEFRWDDDYLETPVATGTDIIAALKKLPDMALANGGLVACDIESRQVFWEDNKILSIGFAYSDRGCLAIYNWPGGALVPLERCETDEQRNVWCALQELFDRKDLTFDWQNGKFDRGRLKYLSGLDCRVDEDTMLKHYAQVNEKQGTHGLKEMGQLYLQAPAWEDELDKYKREFCRKNKIKLSEFMYDSIPVEVLIPYMQRDCIATYRLLGVFDRLKRPGSDFIYRQLVRASNIYGDIELQGQFLDLDYLEEYEAQLDVDIADAAKRLKEAASKVWDPLYYAKCTGAKAKPGDEFNAKSPKQLKWMLEEVLGHPVNSTDATTLANILEDVEAGRIQNDIAADFIRAVSDTRKYGKYLETYALGLRNACCGDSRVRCTFNLHGTETGRLSSSGPNMQNIPRNKAVKNLLIASPGYKLLQLDYSQAELRVLAMLSDDPALIQIYKDGKDLHDAVADMMFGPDGHKDKELRNLAKTINFGIAYGRGPSSIAEKFGKSMAESRQIIEKWFAPMPKVKEFINNRRRMATKGEPCVTLMGRERHFIVTNEELNHVQNEYINTPIQSLASDFTMLSLMDIYDYIKQEDLDARITSTVHDSIIIEVRDGDPELMKKLAKAAIEIMASTPKKFIPDCKVPFKADADVGYKWGEMHKLDLETGVEKVEDN